MLSHSLKRVSLAFDVRSMVVSFAVGLVEVVVLFLVLFYSRFEWVCEMPFPGWL